MSIAAVVTFSGFPGAPECHVVLAEEGYPAAVAHGFASVKLQAGRPAAFLKDFLATQGRVVPQSGASGRPDPWAGSAAYHYRVRLVTRRTTPLMVDCWRRYPGGIGWQRRCGPMALERFLERFMPKGPCGARSKPRRNGLG